MYVPKNRIKTNLYTPGGEYVISSNGDMYVGFYHSLYTGEIYTGKTPNDPPIQLLSPYAPLTDPLWEATDRGVPFQYFAENYDGVLYNGQTQNPDVVNKYNSITNTNIAPIKYVPTTFYPNPTEEDYKLGVFTRYFCVKINEDKYIELDKETYKKLIDRNSEWQWEYYTPFKLQWTLVGDRNYVATTNNNAIRIVQNRLKRQTLALYLRKNYLKFYRP